jgi:hypothetical protein
VVPVVCACGCRHAVGSRVLRNGTCGHVLRNGELREPLGHGETAGPDRTREVELDSGASDWCVRHCRRCCRARKRQVFLVELFDFLGRSDEAVVAVGNCEGNCDGACQDGEDQTEKKTPVGSHGDYGECGKECLSE